MSAPDSAPAVAKLAPSSGKPLLGIGIPAYKRESLLGLLLDSIQAAWPIVVSDNGGNLSAGFKARYPHVRFLVGPEVTVLANWNRAASALETEWIVMPGDDDLYYPESFAVIERTLRANPEADIVFFGHHIINELDAVTATWKLDSEVLAAPAGFDRIRLGTPARPPSIVFRSSLFERLGGFSEAFTVTAGDNHFYQRASLVGNVLFCPEVVSGYRVWSAGSTLSTIATSAWMKEIDLWCLGIQEFAQQRTAYKYDGVLHDEIYAANLRSGIQALKQRGQYLGAWRHLFANRFPYRASLKSQVKLLAHLILPRLK